MATTAPALDIRAERRALWLNIALLVAFAAAIAGAALQDYRIVQQYAWMHTACLVAAMVAGVGLAFCLGGAMHYIDVLLDPLSPARPAWWLRLILMSQRRAFMLLQLVAAALLLGAIVLLIYDITIPGPDYGMLFPGGYTPPAAP